MRYKNVLNKEVNTMSLLFIVIISILSYLLFTKSDYPLKIKFLILIVFSFFIFLIFIYIYQKLILKNQYYPLKELEKGFEQLAHGNLSFRIDNDNEKIDFDDKALFENFNDMANSLELSIHSVEKHQEELNKIIELKTNSLNETNLRLSKAMEELRKSQINKLQSEKQKSLSAIVSGFAHEINNPLTGIFGNLELLALKKDMPDYAMEKHMNIRKQALRIKTIVKELNLMSPDSDQTKLDINLNNFFEKFIKVMNKKDISFKLEFKADSSNNIYITGNHFSLWMVFEGLCENAVEAIKENKIVNGEIILSLNESNDRKYAIITVCDNGGGFEDINKVFDPFYTTRSRTKKKGIGLSIAYNMIREHGGSIEAGNNDTGGTITIKLPLNRS
jgi:signal transduction histidine kinase